MSKYTFEAMESTYTLPVYCTYGERRKLVLLKQGKNQYFNKLSKGF